MINSDLIRQVPIFTDKKSMKSAEHPLVTVNFIGRTKKSRYPTYLGFKNFFVKIKFVLQFSLKI